MGILKFALLNPIKVVVGCLLIILFGMQAVKNMPYELAPAVEYPTITVRTSWSGATPYEIEDEIIERQENALKSLSGLVDMSSRASNGSGSITLQFEMGSDLMEAMLLVTNKLSEVRNYPENVDKPSIRASGVDSSAIVYMLLRLKPDAIGEIDDYRTYVNEEILPFFERIQGVSDIRFFGGKPRQMQVTVLPESLAAYKIPINRLSSVLTQENINMSAGLLALGRQNYRIRTVAEYNAVDDILETVVASDGSSSVKVKDFAHVDFGYGVNDSAVREGDARVMMVGIVKESGANTLSITNEVEQVYNELNAGLLKERGLELEWVFDQRPYINGAIGLVKDNIILGGILAVLVLMVFLRSFAATAIVATAVPISIVGSFIMLSLLGRTLNVISLAGIAFAVGMLIDNAIVVLENIDRHRAMGKGSMEAALDGSSEVWGAVLAATLTTISVFLPVVFVKEEAGQLFMDISIAICSSVVLSMLVSLTVIPMMSKVFYDNIRFKRYLPGISEGIGAWGHAISGKVMRLSNWINSSILRCVVTSVVLMSFSIIVTLLMMPKMEYLPQGNMNSVDANFSLPSGLSLDERTRLGNLFYNEVKPYIGAEVDGYPAIETFYYFVSATGMSASATAVDASRASELVPLLSMLMKRIPGTGGFTTQQGLFQNRFSGGRSIDLIISGNVIEEIIDATSLIMAEVNARYPNVQTRSNPSVNMLFPEAIYVPDSNRLKEVGLDPTALGVAIDVYNDGRKIGEFKDDTLGNIDIMLQTPYMYAKNPEELLGLPLVLSDGSSVPISTVASLELGYGMEDIRRYERKRSFILSMSPPEGMILEQLMDDVRTEIVEPLAADGKLDGVTVRYEGSASKLTQAKDAFFWNFILAVVITYLLMVALFDNFFYPLIVLVTVPLALGGAFIGLSLVNNFIEPQAFDIITMLGFFILFGIVINNAILIVHQTINNTRLYGLPYAEAISKAVESRLRPIMMGAATSVFGMIPLVLFSGAGSELYRGLGSIILGGLTVSTIFTLFMIPALLTLAVRFTNKMLGRK